MSLASDIFEASSLPVEQQYQLYGNGFTMPGGYGPTHLPHAPTHYDGILPFPQQPLPTFGTSSFYMDHQPSVNSYQSTGVSYGVLPLLRETYDTTQADMFYTGPTIDLLQQMQQEQEAAILSEWHSEWEIAERSEKPWVKRPGKGGRRLPCMLTTHARIDLRNHEANAKKVPLNYWGGNHEAPEGVLSQEIRWTQEIWRKKKLAYRRTAAARRPSENTMRGFGCIGQIMQQEMQNNMGVYHQQVV